MGRRESHSGKEGVGSRRTCGPAGSPVRREPRAPVEGLPTYPDFYSSKLQYPADPVPCPRRWKAPN